MPALKNTRHERFAQELAKGKSQTEAYTDAGYKGDVTAASRLSRNVKVQERVAELKERGAIRAEITLQTILDELEQARIAALGAETPQSSAAVSASLGKAKLMGFVVDKAMTATTTVEDLLDQLDGKAG